MSYGNPGGIRSTGRLSGTRKASSKKRPASSKPKTKKTKKGYSK